MKTPCILLFLLLSAVAYGDAVSSLNGKLGFSYGQLDSNDGKSLNGSVAFPVTTNFGAQLDGLYTNVSNHDFYGTGAHFFWRDPDQALVGFAAGGVHSNTVDTYQAGLEAEYYWHWLTLGTYSGVSTIKYAGSTPFISTDKTTGFTTVYLGFYPLPDLLIRPSYNRNLGNTYYGLEAEYALPVHNLTVTVDIATGEHGYDHAMFGLRYYFGGNKSLKARHREDDPVSVTSAAFTAIGTYGAEYNQKAKSYAQSQNLSYTGGGSYGAGTLTLGGGSGTPVIIGSGGSLTLSHAPLSGSTLIISGSSNQTFNLAGSPYTLAPGSYLVQITGGVYQFTPIP